MFYIFENKLQKLILTKAFDGLLFYSSRFYLIEEER